MDLIALSWPQIYRTDLSVTATAIPNCTASLAKERHDLGAIPSHNDNLTIFIKDIPNQERKLIDVEICETRIVSKKR